MGWPPKIPDSGGPPQPRRGPPLPSTQAQVEEQSRPVFLIGLGLIVALVIIGLVLIFGGGGGNSGGGSGGCALSWHAATVDGDSNEGEMVDADVGRDAVDTVAMAGRPHVFYYDATHGDLRHAWYNGDQWLHEVVDGRGGPDGRVDANVGASIAAVAIGNQFQVFYRRGALDDPDPSVRYAQWDGTRWRTTQLHVPTPDSKLTAAAYQGQAHLWYWSDGRLVHEWVAGGQITGEILTDPRVPGGRPADFDAPLTPIVNSTVSLWFNDTFMHQMQRVDYVPGSGWIFSAISADGAQPSGTVRYNQPQIFYTDGGDLMRLMPGPPAESETVATDAAEPADPTPMEVGNYLHVAYVGNEGGMRHTWFSAGRWHDETIDGAPSPCADGSTGDPLATPLDALVFTDPDGAPTLFVAAYEPEQGNLRAAWATCQTDASSAQGAAGDSDHAGCPPKG